MSSEPDGPRGDAPGRARDRGVLGSLTLRLRVRRRRRSLDRALSQGASPRSSLELTWRAQLLALPRTRAGLARELANLIDAAEEPAAHWLAHGIDPPLRTSAVLLARAEVVALAERLASDCPASIQGLALATVLIEDPSSPIYSTPAQVDVDDTARRARMIVGTRAGSVAIPPAYCHPRALISYTTDSLQNTPQRVQTALDTLAGLPLAVLARRGGWFAYSFMAAERAGRRFG